VINCVLMVCTANICRSPIAEAVWAHLASESTVFSRGLQAVVGRDADPHSRAVCEAINMPIAENKRAIQLTSVDIQRASLILVMDNGHKHLVQSRYPGASGKTFLLGHWSKVEVADPVGQDRPAFETAFSVIRAESEKWVERARKM
jgi:protein-tyrosine phosphatase